VYHSSCSSLSNRGAQRSAALAFVVSYSHLISVLYEILSFAMCESSRLAILPRLEVHWL